MTNKSAPLDIAISFANEDLGVATELRDGIGQAFDVFLYTRKQEDLAGTDGLQSFRDVFRSRARLVVILYREQWGKTPWTRVEEEAITDRFLKEGPDFLFVVMMDDSAPPPWLPDKLIRFSLKDFGTVEAVGAIKARALERGSKISRPSLSFLALRSHELARFGAERGALLRSQKGVQAAQQEAERLMESLSGRAEECVAAAPDLGVQYGSSTTAFAIRTPDVSVTCAYFNNIINVLDEARLLIREVRGSVLLPGEQGYYWREPKELSRLVLIPDLSRDLGWCWKRGDNTLLSSDQTATICFEMFFHLLDRQSAGELPGLAW